MPRFEYTNEVERYDTKEEDIKIGDIRWVNFPSIHRYDRLPNGDSTRCIRHPGLIIDKIEGAKRCIKVAEISHRHTGFERRLGNSPYFVTCDILAILTPDHFSETLDHFDPESDEFKEIIDHIKYAEDVGRQVVLTQEQMIGMMNEEATSTKIPNMEFKKSNDGTYNAITYINGHMYRPRAEILILNEEGEVLLRKSKEVNQYGTKYNLPGGGFDNPNEKPEDVAFRESCEEVRIVPKDVKYTGIVYISEYGDKVPEWHKRILWPVGIKYVGAISYVCTGTYDKRYNQYIKVKDRQDYIDEYNFYEYDDIKTMLRQEHIEALNMYHEEHNESNMLKEGFTEIMGNKKDRSPLHKAYKSLLRHEGSRYHITFRILRIM